jgi:hypothetical protein
LHDAVLGGYVHGDQVRRRWWEVAVRVLGRCIWCEGSNAAFELGGGHGRHSVGVERGVEVRAVVSASLVDETSVIVPRIILRLI